MKRIRFHKLMGPALLGVCLAACKGEARPAAEPPAAAAAAPAHAPDMIQALPILFDYRQVVAAQDVSGLEPGTHTVEFDVYAPLDVGWTPEAERSVRDAIQVLHVDQGTPAATRVAFEPLKDRPDARRARVEMDLTERGAWVVMLGGGLLAAHADPELLSRYDVREPEALRPAGDHEFLSPGLMLRTVGSCNHVHKVTTEADAGGVLRVVRLHFSEAVSPKEAARGVSADIEGPDGRRLASVAAQGSPVAGNVIELRVPPARGAQGVLSIPLGHIPGFAGRFRDLLSCDEGEGSIGVGYLFGEQPSGEHVVSPLQQAASRALGEDRK